MNARNLLKKLSIGVASFTLICPLAMNGLNNTNVNARRRHVRTHRVYRHRRVAKRTRKFRYAKRVRKHAKRRVRRYHESQAQWYKNNGWRMYRWNVNRNKMFRKGLEDAGATNTDYQGTFINRNYIKSNEYKNGFIVGDADVRSNGSTYASAWLNTQDIKGYSKKSYTKALSHWNNGMAYLKLHPNYNLISLGYDTGAWNKADEVD